MSIWISVRRFSSGVLRAATLSTALLAACAHDPYMVSVDTTGWIRALGSDDMNESDTAEEGLVALGSAALPALAAGLRREPAAVRAGISETLGRIDDPGAIALLVGIAGNDPDEEVRYEALRALWGTTDPSLQALAEETLDDPSPRVRYAAVQLCPAACASRTAVERLVVIAIEDPRPINGAVARAALAQVLESDAGPGWRPIVQERARASLVSASTAEFRTRAALLSSSLGDPAALPVLVEAATDGSAVLQLQAVYALGESGDERAVRPLADLFDGAPQIVAMYGYQALSMLAEKGIPGAPAALRRYPGTPPKLPLPRPGS